MIMSATLKLVFHNFGNNASKVFNKARFSTCVRKIGRPKQKSMQTICIHGRVNTVKMNAVTVYINYKSYCTNGSDEDDQTFKNDPELKELIKQFRSDFGHSSDIKEGTESLDNSQSCAEIKSESQDDQDAPQTEDEKRLKYYKVQEQIVEAEIQEMYTEGNEYVYEYETEVKAPPVSLERGQTGVFDLAEIVDLLRSENASDLCVLEIPPATFYVNHMVLATGRSYRHRLAIAEYIKKLFKKKRTSADPPTTRIEGKGSKNWLALDLGNIAVHLFEEQTREHYDLESLWSVGPEHDDLAQVQEDIADPWTALISERDFFKNINSELEEVASDTEIITVQTDDIVDTSSMESVSGWHEIQEDKPS